MSAGGDDLGKVVFAEVGDEGLNLLDRPLLDAVEETIEAREVVDELSSWNKKLG